MTEKDKLKELQFLKDLKDEAICKSYGGSAKISTTTLVFMIDKMALYVKALRNTEEKLEMERETNKALCDTIKSIAITSSME